MLPAIVKIGAVKLVIANWLNEQKRIMIDGIIAVETRATSGYYIYTQDQRRITVSGRVRDEGADWKICLSMLNQPEAAGSKIYNFGQKSKEFPK
ncbi:hypothetical protein ACTXT7_012253 [Hymenolepis weldensis]